MSKKKRIYISLPITDRDIEKQKARAEELARRIISKGMEPVNPFELSKRVDEDREDGDEATWYDYMAEDLFHLLQCDGILVDSDAKKAYGCSIELAVAQAMAASSRKNFFIYHTKEQWASVKSKYII